MKSTQNKLWFILAGSLDHMNLAMYKYITKDTTEGKKRYRIRMNNLCQINKLNKMQKNSFKDINFFKSNLSRNRKTK